MSAVNPQKPPICFLFDNGSLRAESILSLRRTASALSKRLGVEVKAASLRHSDKVRAADLGGEPAALLLPMLTGFLTANPAARVVLVPLFFGPGRVLGGFARQLEVLRRQFAGASIVQAPCLIDPTEADDRVASALAEAVMLLVEEKNLRQPKVVLVDHGSPEKAVTEIRDHLGRQLREILKNRVSLVAVASMEKRTGPEFVFNDPLLSERLRTPPFDDGEVVVALQFLSPGRHAGEDGDVAQLCAEACSERPFLRTHVTRTLAEDPRVIAVLADRYGRAAAALA